MRPTTLAWISCATFFALGALDGCKGKPSNNQNNKPQCTSRADCQDGEICAGGVCGPCSRDRECNRNELCRPDTRRCALMECFGNDCKLNSDCPLGQFCVQGLCLTPPSTNNCPVVTCTQD